MKKHTLVQKMINTAAIIGIILFSAIPTYASAHTLVFDESRDNPYQLQQDHAQCFVLPNKVGPH